MTNYEHYKERIEEISNMSEDYSIAIVNDVPYSCDEVNCSKCESKCSISKIIEWSFKEYKEPIALTKQQEHFLKSLKKGCLTRDKLGELSYKITERSNRYSLYNIEYLIGRFNFIKEDNTDWNIEEILEQTK